MSFSLRGYTPAVFFTHRACFIVLLTLAFGAGCYHYVPKTDQQRSDSLSILHDPVVGGIPLLQYARQRSAVIFSASSPIYPMGMKGDRAMIGLGKHASGVIGSASRAIAITHDGYFLTAAHCIDQSRAFLVYHRGDAVAVSEARIVARIWAPSRQVDFAIVHVDAQVPDIFEWADEGELTSGAAAIAVGLGKMSIIAPKVGAIATQCVAGHLMEIKPVGNGVMEIWHDLPGREGDSGGPVVGLNGKLLAIQKGYRIEWSNKQFAFALRPDLKWVQETIEADRQSMHQSKPPLSSEPPEDDPPRLLIGL